MTIPPDKAMDLRMMKALLYKIPDIREDMIADLRSQVLGNVYIVEAEQVAGSIMDHGICILSALGISNWHPP